MKKQSVYKQVVQDEKIFTISNIVSFFRIFLAPVIVCGIFYEQWTIVFGLIFIAGSTDMLDGYLARKFNQETDLGKMLDPIADKILLVSLFGALAFLQSPSFPIPTWFVYFIIFREVTIMSGSYALVKIGKELKVKPTIWGKLTTFFQLLFIMWLFTCYFFGWVPAKTYHAILIFLPIFSLLSLLQYVKIGINYLKKT